MQKEVAILTEMVCEKNKLPEKIFNKTSGLPAETGNTAFILTCIKELSKYEKDFLQVVESREKYFLQNTAGNLQVSFRLPVTKN